MTETTETLPKGGAANEFVEVVKTVVYALLIALVLRIIFFQPFTIPSASMEPNLYEGDYLIVTKYAYGYSRHSIPFSPPFLPGRVFAKTPERGDVVVFKLPRDGHTDYIKRLVGLPGDRIQVRSGLLYINETQVPRFALPSVNRRRSYGDVATRFQEVLPGGRRIVTNDFGTDQSLDNTEVFVVPEGHYFMMGDNRDNSQDSRVPAEAGGVGFVPEENLVGEARIILFSWYPGASIFKPWTWVMNARPSRFFHDLR
jgi:signal peptidase I